MPTYVNACPACRERVSRGEVRFQGRILQLDQTQVSDFLNGRPCQICRPMAADVEFPETADLPWDGMPLGEA